MHTENAKTRVARSALECIRSSGFFGFRQVSDRNCRRRVPNRNPTTENLQTERAHKISAHAIRPANPVPDAAADSISNAEHVRAVKRSDVGCRDDGFFFSV